MSALIASGFTACTDDHFDINSDVLGKETIWQNIKSNPNLSEYADILQSVNYSQTEQKTTPETYADLFNGDQTFTVWAPVNGSFKYSYYKELLKSGNRDSIYKVEKELIRNNMTRYTNIMNGEDSIKVMLFNDKAAWINHANNSIKNSKITTPNIGSSNGVLHITDKPVDYQYNLYEYMAANPELDSLNQFIKGFQTIIFNEDASTKGPTIDGHITWVDSITSVYNTYNSIFLRAYLEREDSNYVMIMPTNEAWRETLAKTKKYYHFKSSYKQDINTQTETGKDTTIAGQETKFTQAELDSIVNLRSKNAICQNLAFNANWQYERVPISNINDIRALDARKDSLISTFGLKFKKTGTLNLTNLYNVVEVDNYADMFGNAEPTETSNGQAYVVNKFNFPTTVYAPVINDNAVSDYESCDNQCVVSSFTMTFKDDAVTDSVYKNTYLKLSPKSATSNPGAFFKIEDVLSTKYDIFVVIGYNIDYNLQNKFRAYISYDKEEKRVENEPLKNPNEDNVDAKGNSIFGSNYFVNKPFIERDADSVISKFNVTDTICIAKDFEFPVCYDGLKNAYPVIQIKSNFTSSEKTYYSREIWVEKLILKPKE